MGSLLSLCAPLVLAQDAILAVPGSRVRIRTTAQSGTSQDRAALVPGVVGTLVRVEGDTVTLKVDGTEQMLGVARRSIIKFEVSAGKRSRTKNALVGAAIGAGAGAVTGVVIGLASDADGAYAVMDGIVLGFLASMVGAGVGAVLPTPERWMELPVDRIRVSVTPVRGPGVAVSLHVAF